MTNYQTFAKLYDDLFDDDAYADWLQYAVKQIKNPKAPLLELAGGAGRLALKLKQKNFDVTVFDLSEEMLSLAQKHAAEAQVDLPLVQGDMREWSDYPKQFGTITSFADSFNYLADEAETLMAFQQVYDHLTMGGQFLFDVITPYQTDVYYPGYMYNYHDDEVAFLWSSYGIEDAVHTVEHELIFFIYDEAIDGYRQLTEIHTERTYNLDTYKRLLTQAGFVNIEVTGDFGRQKQVNNQTNRWFFSAQKG